MLRLPLTAEGPFTHWAYAMRQRLLRDEAEITQVELNLSARREVRNDQPPHNRQIQNTVFDFILFVEHGLNASVQKSWNGPPEQLAMAKELSRRILSNLESIKATGNVSYHDLIRLIVNVSKAFSLFIVHPALNRDVRDLMTAIEHPTTLATRNPYVGPLASARQLDRIEPDLLMIFPVVRPLSIEEALHLAPFPVAPAVIHVNPVQVERRLHLPIDLLFEDLFVAAEMTRAERISMEANKNDLLHIQSGAEEIFQTLQKIQDRWNLKREIFLHLFNAKLEHSDRLAAMFVLFNLVRLPRPYLGQSAEPQVLAFDAHDLARGLSDPRTLQILREDFCNSMPRSTQYPSYRVAGSDRLDLSNCLNSAYAFLREIFSDSP